MKKNLKKILKNAPDKLKVFYKNPKKYRFQVIYTPITQFGDKKILGKPQRFGIKDNEYFYPASVVKLPIVLCALEKLKNLNNPLLTTQTAMQFEAGRKPQTEAKADSTAKNQLITMGHYIEKIFVTSDNDASNRLYEFLGQQYLNEKMREKGYTSFAVTHRLAAPQYTIEDNRYTNPMAFFELIKSQQQLELENNQALQNAQEAEMLKKNQENDKNITYISPENSPEKTTLNHQKSTKKEIAKINTEPQKPQENNQIVENKGIESGVNKFFEKNILYKQNEVLNTRNFFHKAKNSLIGKGYQSGDNLVKEPLSFKQRNFFALKDMHEVLKSVFFPENCPKKSLFELRNEDLALVKNAMKMLPRQSNITAYQHLPDNYAKYLYKNLKNNEKIPEHVTIYNKVGMAFGFLVENAYIINEKTGKSCLISVSMYVNEDEILNDDVYEYDTLAFPLLEYLRKELIER